MTSISETTDADLRLAIVEKVIINSKKVNEYLGHPDHCGIHMTEFCDCGLREARIAWKAALKELEVADGSKS